MSVNLASKYSKKIDEKFAETAVTDKLGGLDFDIQGVKTVYVYEIDLAEENDYTREGTNRYGEPQELGDSVHPHEMTQDKAFTFTIDRGNKTQQMMIKEAGKRLAAQIKNVTTPNRDRYNLTVIATLAKLRGNVESNSSMTKSNIYEKFTNVMGYMDDDGIPTAGRLCYARPQIYNLLKRSDEFTKFVDAGKKLNINGAIGEIDDTAIIKAKSKFFPAGVDMIFVHPKVAGTPKQLADYKIHDNPPGINGWLCEGRVIYDCFTSEANPKGVYIVASDVGLITESRKGKTTGTTRLIPVKPNTGDEAALTYKYKLDTAEIAKPTDGSTVTGYTDLPSSKTEIAASTNTHYMIVALKDGKVFLSGGGAIVKA